MIESMVTGKLATTPLHAGIFVTITLMELPKGNIYDNDNDRHVYSFVLTSKYM